MQRLQGRARAIEKSFQSRQAWALQAHRRQPDRKACGGVPAPATVDSPCQKLELNPATQSNSSATQLCKCSKFLIT
eukprot:13260211-Alexandrium_andersonii.AAC.1